MPRVGAVRVDPELCDGCLECAYYCPHGLLRHAQTPNELGIFPVKIFNSSRCQGCGLCLQGCTVGALTPFKASRHRAD